jgi:cytochrome c-type biogenesis protein CcmH/NrfF
MRPLLVLVAILGASSPAWARPSDENRPANDAEKALMHGIACTCDMCNKEPIDESGCDNAAKMRRAVQAELAKGKDAPAVRAEIASIFGAAALTPSAPPREARLNWLPIVIFAGGFLVLLDVTRRSMARRRAEKARLRDQRLS